MVKRTYRLTLDQRARYRIQVVGHLDSKRAAWFESLDLVQEYGEEGTPVTTMTLEVLDQAMLHGLLAEIRDLGLPLLALQWVR
jgi:hypothetical protein